MEFIRSDSGIKNRYLLYFPKILVYVEGYSDIPFYEEVLQNYDYHLKARGGKKECEKLVTDIVEKDLPYVVILDGDYEILEHSRSQHRRIVWLHRHSCENYLLEENPIEKFRHYRAPLEDSLERLPSSFKEIVEDTELNFKELLILDVAHQRAKTGYKVLPKGAEGFFVGSTADFEDSRIQERCSEATSRLDEQSIAEARILVRAFLENHRFIDLLPGHFAFSIIRRWINYTINVRQRILEEDMRIYLSTEVWRSVKTRDHNSLKTRLRRAVREAEQMRKSSSNSVQSSTGS